MRDIGVLRWLALSLPLFATVASTAQRPAVSDDTKRVIAVDGDCRFHPGDDPEAKLGWALAAFDDSAWQTMARWPTTQSREPYFWLRCRFNPAPVSPDILPTLQVSGDFSYQLFLNGHLLGEFGNLFTGRHTAGLVHQYSAAEFSDRSHPFLIALRIAVYPTNYDLQPLPRLTLGPSAVLRDQHTARVARAVAAKSVIWLSYIVIAGAGLFFLALYLFDRSQVMLIWVSIAWLSLTLIRLSEFLVTASIPIPSAFEYLCYSVGHTNPFATILFFFALAARPITRFMRIVAIFSIALTAPLILVPLFPLKEAMDIRWLMETEKNLDGAQVDASFQHMRGEAMPQRMRRYMLGDPGTLGCLVHRLPDDLLCDGNVGPPALHRPWEQVSLGLHPAPVTRAVSPAASESALHRDHGHPCPGAHG